MVKRHTESDKWKDPWFRRLRPIEKLAYLYLVDNCDIAGLLDLDEDLASFQIGGDVDWQAFFEAAGDRFHRLQSGKIWVVKFIRFQQNGPELNPSNNCHKGILERLCDAGITPQEHGFLIKNTSPTGAPSEPLSRGTSKSNSKSNSKGKRKSKGQPPFDPASVELPFDSDDFRAAWSNWAKHRIEIKTPLTPTSVGQQLRRLSELGERAAIEMLRHTVEKGWTGLRAPERSARGRETARAASSRRGVL